METDTHLAINRLIQASNDAEQKEILTAIRKFETEK